MKYGNIQYNYTANYMSKLKVICLSNFIFVEKFVLTLLSWALQNKQHNTHLPLYINHVKVSRWPNQSYVLCCHSKNHTHLLLLHWHMAKIHQSRGFIKISFCGLLGTRRTYPISVETCVIHELFCHWLCNSYIFIKCDSRYLSLKQIIYITLKPCTGISQ